jgi:hypothetical protein
MSGNRRAFATSSVAQQARKESVVTLRICGESLAIAGLPSELQERFRALMLPFAAEFDPTDAIHQLQVKQQGSDMAIVRDGKVVAAYGDAHLLLTQLEWHAVTAALEATEAYVAVHGAALARGPAAVLLLAESGAGKTTLTLGLMRRGWQPLADDIVLIDPEKLAIQAFPRCFHVDDSTRELVTDDALIEWPGLVPGYARPRHWAEGRHSPHTILLVERCPTYPSRLRGLTLAEAAAAIGTNALRGRLARSELAKIAVRMATGATGGGRLSNGHLDDALDLIESAVAR